MVSWVRVVGSVRAASWISCAGEGAVAVDCHLREVERRSEWRVRDLSCLCARGLLVLVLVLVLGWRAEVA